MLQTKPDVKLFWTGVQTAGLVVSVVFSVAMFGILTRPLGFLAAIWPANAVLLGLLVLQPRFSGLVGWGAAAIGFLTAGFVTGDETLTNLWLTGANLTGVATGWVLFNRLGLEDRRLRRPLSMLHLFLICVVASSAASVVGCGLAPLLFDRPISTGLTFWFTTELSNYIIVLPVLLAAPGTFHQEALAARFRSTIFDPAKIAPVIALCVSVAGSVVVGGAGAIAFSVPALLWCALSYDLFPVGFIVLAFSVTMMMAESLGIMRLPEIYDYLDETTSFRLGITLLALGPLTVTTIIVEQRELMKELDRAISLDGLTGILARRAYLERSLAALAGPANREPFGVALMMIDIDHFKDFNDRFGHAVGDRVLIAVAEAIKQNLRKADLFGRMGGEEFAVTLWGVSDAEAVIMAERLRLAVEQASIKIENGQLLRATVSIGILHRARFPASDLADMLPLADAALYRAKAGGRNRIAVSV